MMIVRVVIFFLVVIITCCYTSYMLSSKFMMMALDSKNEVIEKNNETIDALIKQNTHQKLVIDNMEDVIKQGIKSGCIKNNDGLY